MGICAADILTGSGPILVDLPTPTAVLTFTGSNGQITCPGDAAATSHSPPQPVDCVVAMSDGTNRTLIDSRAVLMVTGGALRSWTTTMLLTHRSCLRQHLHATSFWPPIEHYATLNATLKSEAFDHCGRRSGCVTLQRI
jgi:hypothetical protein